MPRVLNDGRIVTRPGVVPLDHELKIGQRNYGGENWRVSVCPIEGEDTDWTPIAERGCSTIAASAGFWLADLRGAGGGVFGVGGDLHPEWALPASQDGRGFGAHGVIAVSTPQAIGLWLVRSNGEATLSLPDAEVFSDLCVSVVSPTQVAWISWPDRVFRQVGMVECLTLPDAHLGGLQVHAIDGEWWISYFHSDALGIVLHPYDSFMGYIVTGIPAFFIHGAQTGPKLVRFAWGLDSAETFINLRDLSLTEPRRNLLDLIDQPVPDPPPPVPLSEPRYADDRVYDLGEYFLCEPALRSRRGPTHAADFVGPDAEGRFYEVKFGDPQFYESFAIDDNWIVQLEDASGADFTNYYPENPRWYPRRMQIGEAFAYDSGIHDRVFKKRDGTCRRERLEEVGRRMWIHAVYDAYDWSSDLGVRPTILLVYDPTGGIHTPERGIELNFYAQGAGWVRWEYHRSDIVFASGKAQFSDASLLTRSDFYLLAQNNLSPRLTGCVSQTVPHFPPWTPAPEPEPEPPEPEEPVMIAYTLPIDGKLLKDFHPGELVKNGNGTVSVKKPNGKFLCITPDKNVEERDSPGGPWESFQQTPTSLMAWRDQQAPNDTVYVLLLQGA